MTLIEVTNVRKSYAGREVVRGIDLEVAAGEVFGILGPNGAGKTTTVEMIGGLRRRDGGTIRVAGMDPEKEPRELREQLGIQLQEARQPGKITVRESIELFRSFYRHPLDADDLIQRFGLRDQAGQRFEVLSGGQRQRLSVALALVGNPRIAILDELTTGLDPAARRDIWTFLIDLRRDGMTIVLVTHSMDEAQFLCDRVAIIDNGRVLAIDTPAGLAGRSGQTVISFTTPSPEAAMAAIGDVSSLVRITATGHRVTADGTDESPTHVLARLLQVGIAPVGLRITTPTLDDAYLALTPQEPAPIPKEPAPTPKDPTPTRKETGR